MKKRLVHLFLASALILCMLPAGALADTDTDLSDQEFLMQGGEITLTRDMTVEGTIEITVDTVLDLNGHTITGTTDRSRLTVSNAATFTLKNGALESITIENSGMIESISDVIAHYSDGEILNNHVGIVRVIRRCIFDGVGNTIENHHSGVIDLIEDCEIIGHTYPAIVNYANGIIGAIRHCRLIGDQSEAFGGGHADGGMTEIVDSVLVSHSLGGIATEDGFIHAKNCVIVNTSTNWGYSEKEAVWIHGAICTPPRLTDCTLIASEGPCGYSDVVQTDHGLDRVYFEKADMTNCTFIPLDEVVDLNRYTQWTMASSSDSTKSPFTDVPDWARESVEWAVEKNITNGMTETTFQPDTQCTDQMILTFIRRFVDGGTKDGDYAGAVAWAVEQKLAAEGEVQNTTLCTRAKAVTYLWKLAGSPVVEASDTFIDVPPDAAWSDAAAWAVANGITNGMGENTFRPDTICSRGQIVTFLQRYANNIKAA